jgi:hypothetical protein
LRREADLYSLVSPKPEDVEILGFRLFVDNSTLCLLFYRQIALPFTACKIVGNKKKAETFCDGELPLQAGLGSFMVVFSKKLSSWFFSGFS